MHDLNPVLLNLGPLQIRYYGLVYFLTAIFAYFFLKKKTKETKIEKVDDLLFYALVGMLIGARLFAVNILENPLEVFKIWHGGMSFFGSLLGTTTAIIIYCKKHNKNFWKVTDLLVFPVTIGLIFGRIANFINAELVGTVTNLPWCVVFPAYQECRHPYQIYAAISHILLLGIIYIIYKIKQAKQLKSGIVFLGFIFFYSIIRFVTDFVREGQRYFGLTHWQYVSIAAAVITAIIFLKRYKNLINKK